jgi:hypothetical protein
MLQVCNGTRRSRNRPKAYARLEKFIEKLYKMRSNPKAKLLYLFWRAVRDLTLRLKLSRTQRLNLYVAIIRWFISLISAKTAKSKLLPPPKASFIPIPRTEVRGYARSDSLVCPLTFYRGGLSYALKFSQNLNTKKPLLSIET